MRDVHYIALIHKDLDTGYGVSFPDVPGVIAAADTLDEAISKAAAVLAFAFEDMPEGQPMPRTLEELRVDAEYQAAAVDAVVAVVRPSSEYYQAAE